MIRKIGVIIMVFFLPLSIFQWSCKEVQANEIVSEGTSETEVSKENDETRTSATESSLETELQGSNIKSLEEPLPRKAPILSGNVVKLDDVFNHAVGNGVSYTSDEIVTLSDSTSQTGAIWAKEKLDLNKPFSLTFYLYLGNNKTVAGDGMTLTFQSKNASWLGDAGENLGVYKSGQSSQKDLLALEFDTYMNSGSGNDQLEKLTQHVAFRTSGSPYEPHYGSTALSFGNNLSNGKWKKVTVDYKVNSPGNGTMSYNFMDISQDGSPDGNNLRSSVTFNYDGKGAIPAFNTSEVFWGFTSSTGAYWEENAVAFESLPEQGSIKGKDSTIYIGQTWSPSDNILSATDSFGKAIDINDLQVYVDGVLNGKLDTSKAGVHKVKYEYLEQMNGLADKLITTEVTVTVLKSTTVTAKPQVLKYADIDSAKFNARDFVEVKDENDNASTNYTARFVSFPDSLDGTEAVVEVTDHNNRVFTVNVPVTYEFGNSLNILSMNDKRSATFSLDDSISTIIGTYDYEKSADTIHSGFSNTIYYEFTHYWKSTIVKGALNNQTPDTKFTALGNDRIDLLNNFSAGRKLPVSKGDIVGIYHAESENRLQNFENSILQPTPDSANKNNWYQITDAGFELLGLNRLTASEQTIDFMTSTSELDASVEKYLDTAKYPNVKVVRFTDYPDTSRIGLSVGKILVEELLINGEKAQYEYEVAFNVDDSKIINVTFPTKVIFWSEDGTPTTPDNNDHTVLKSAEYKIINNNAKRPVKVSIGNYNSKSNVLGIKNLQLTMGDQTLDIVTDTKDTSASLTGASIKLDRTTNDLLTEEPSISLTLSGETDLNNFTPDKVKKLTHTLNLEFQTLDETGN